MSRGSKRFSDLLEKLDALANKSNDPETKMVLDEVKFWMRSYIEPWQCPACGCYQKVPEFDSEPRKCPKCGSRAMFPYSFLEAERMNAQLSIALQCVNYYSRKSNGKVAKQTIQSLSQVDPKGAWDGTPCVDAQNYFKKASGPRRSKFPFFNLRGSN